MKLSIVVYLAICYFTRLGHEAINSGEFCLKPQTQCSKHNVCEWMKCAGKFRFRCDFETCVSNRTACVLFKTLKKEIKFEILPFVYQNSHWLFHKFIKSIKVCPYEWSPLDLCARGTDCFMLHQIQIEDDLMSLYEKIECTCNKSDFELNCLDRNYCGKSLNACQAAESNKSMLSTNIITPCHVGPQLKFKRIL